MAKKIKEPFMAINFELAIANQAKKANQAVKKKSFHFCFGWDVFQSQAPYKPVKLKLNKTKRPSHGIGLLIFLVSFFPLAAYNLTRESV